jgi:hypothetical protein
MNPMNPPAPGGAPAQADVQLLQAGQAPNACRQFLQEVAIGDGQVLKTAQEAQAVRKVREAVTVAQVQLAKQGKVACKEI